MSAKIITGFLLAVGLCGLPRLAEAADTGDIVILRDGTRVEGRIVQQQPGKFVTIRTAEGAERTLSWEKIDEVSAVARPESAPGPAAPVTTTTTTVHANANGAELSREVDCTNGSGPACTKTTVAVDAKGPRAAYVSDADCGKNGETNCHQHTSVGVDKGGIGASFTEERVTRVAEPPSGAVNVALDAGGGGLVGPSVSTAFLSADLKIRLLAGGKFPGKEGGGWSGLALEPSIAVLCLFFEQPSTGYSSSTTSTLVGVQLGGTLGYQFMHFGEMDSSSLKQSGVGILLGGYVGATGIDSGTASAGSGSSSMTWSPSYGPVLSLSFPSYNAGTAHYSAFNLTAMVLPAGDTGMFVSGSLGVLL